MTQRTEGKGAHGQRQAAAEMPIALPERRRGAPAAPRGASAFLRPKEPIPRPLRLGLGIAGVALLVLAWSAVTYGGFVSSYFLPAPDQVIRRLGDMFASRGFALDVWASTYRIFLGFLLAAAIAVPLGVLMGSFGAFQAFFEPVIGAIRYMPASAFIPLLIIWLGIDDSQKVGVIFIGVFFPLTLLISDVSAGVSKDLINSAYTLGATQRQVFFSVLLPASWPGIFDNLRITIGWAWTYLIVAELVGANRGIGSVILQGQRFLVTDQVIAGILVIGALGILTDILFRALYAWLFPYADGSRS